ncbi:DNA mismatch repair protein msh6, variant 2 [Balamuthia mandrillaris]
MRPQQQSLRNYFGGNSSGGPPRPSTSGFSYPPPATASSLSSSVSDWGSRERGFSFSPSPPTKPFIPPSASPPPVTTTSSPPPTSSFSSSPPDSSNPPLCSGHNLPCALRTVQKNNANKGRRFWTCPMPQDEQCRSFRWAEEGQVSSPPLSPPRSPQPPSSSASQTASTAPITSYFQPRGKVEGGSVKATSSPFFGNSNTSSASQPEPSTHSAASRRLFSSSSSSFSSSSSAASSFASPSSSDSASTSTWSGFSMTQPQQQPFKERSNQELLAMLSQQQQPNSYQYQHHQESIINSAPSSFHVDSSGPSSLPSASAFAFRPSSSISSSKATQPTTNNVNDSFNNKRARSPEPQPAFYQSVSQTQPQRQELQRQSTTSQTNIVSPRKPSASSSMMRVGVSSDDTDAFPSKRKRPNQMEMEDGDNDVSDALLDLDREEWYWIKHPKDAKGNEPGSPDYDPSTLYVPVNALLNMTETERQYWEIKSKHWDKLVFFKVGKFYELYNKDADVGHQVLDLKLTTKKSRKGAWNMRQAGVPQQKFDPWCAKLVGLGYKLVIVDETETRIGANVRMRENAKKGVRQSRAITREVSRILTRGTLVDESLLNDPRANYLMVIKESLDAPEEENRVYDTLEAPSLPRQREPPHPRFGICLVDASTGDFNIYEFVDDAARNHLETLLLREKPQEVLYERGKCSRQTMSAIKRNLTCPTLNARSTDDEFWTAAKTVDHFRETNYFHKSDPDHPSPMNIEDSWPNELQMLAAEKKDLALSALGACVQYLQELHLDQELISLRKFHIYQDVGDGRVTTDYLILDGKTLVNLEIFENTVDGGPEGTLLKLMDHCVSPFGKRLFRRWLTKPLHNVADINDRLDAVEDFNNMDDTQMMGFRSRLEECLKNLPDLERLISRIHAGSANIKQFLRVLIGFEQIWNLITEEFQRIAVKSKLLQALLTVNSRTTPSGRQGLFPSTLGEPLGNFRTAFDWDTAIERDKIIPNEGTDEGYDQARARVADVENALEMHLQEQRDLLGRFRLGYETFKHDALTLSLSLSLVFCLATR